jgi:hypothetical protein
VVWPVQSILADVKAMEFAPDLFEIDAEADRTASQDTKDEVCIHFISGMHYLTWN